MAETISEHDLSTRSAEVMRRLDGGESFIVTRNGKPVGDLTPLRRHHFVKADAAIALFSGTPGIDAARFRADLEKSATQNTQPLI